MTFTKNPGQSQSNAIFCLNFINLAPIVQFLQFVNQKILVKMLNPPDLTNQFEKNPNIYFLFGLMLCFLTYPLILTRCKKDVT